MFWYPTRSAARASEKVSQDGGGRRQGPAERVGKGRYRRRGGGQGSRDRLVVDHRSPAPAEGGQVLRRSGAVEANRLLNGTIGHGEAPVLVGRAEHDQVGGQMLAEQPFGDPLGVEVQVLGAPGGPVDARLCR